MKGEIIVNINKIGKVGNIAANVLRIALIVAFVFLLTCLIAAVCLPKDLVKVEIGTQTGVQVDVSHFGEMSEEGQASFEDELEKLKENGVQISDIVVTESIISVSVADTPKTYGMNDFIGVLILAIFYVCGGYVFLWFISMLCRAFRDCESPFDDNVIRRMRNFSFVIIGWSVLKIVLNILFPVFVNNTAKIYIGGSIGTILFVLVILGLCGIFRYGAKLQKEHDETL